MARLKPKIPYTEISNETGLSLSTVKNAFKKEGNPTVYTAKKISESLNIPPRKLFFSDVYSPKEVLENYLDTLQSEEVEV